MDKRYEKIDENTMHVAKPTAVSYDLLLRKKEMYEALLSEINADIVKAIELGLIKKS
jgi:hypothetical protein